MLQYNLNHKSFYKTLAVFALVHIQTVFGLVCDVMSVMQLSIMEHNGINLKEKLVRFASIEEKHNGVLVLSIISSCLSLAS